MATTAEPATRTQDRHMRRRPFAWMRRLANLKGSSSDTSHAIGKKHSSGSGKAKKTNANKNNPYPESGRFNKAPTVASERPSFVSSPISHNNGSLTSFEQPDGRFGAKSMKSTAPTLATNPETVHSEGGQSKTGTSNTVGGGANSTFSSPNHSERSLTTTLTTVQSTAPSAMLNHQPNAPNHGQGHTASTPTVHFSHQFPSSPASAIPSHLAPSQHPHTYSAATANNILSDNASILTLASSSKRRRRHSFDTDASVRALAPSSVWGGSRESLPLSVLSSNIDSATVAGTSGAAGRPSIGGLASAERASLYSNSGVAAPALSSERNSYYAGKGLEGTGASSVRSGLLGHGRNDSITGSIGGGTAGGVSTATGSPLASPREPPSAGGRMSRRSSDWRGMDDMDESGDETGKENDEPYVAEGKGKGKEKEDS